ncbi:jg23872 [Pararge aegeria aegeria]|uniref:Jg23872 protein n=1 Tax=Pararge aegeria aegeria TaxID=348720 RepID=A0A8S4RRG5_9NEOP|nr:jg23872 [Pararge aegeria aegeria]
MRRPLRIVSATSLARAGSGGAERGQVAGGACRAQARQQRRLIRLGGRGRLARQAQRARGRPHRKHQCDHGAYRAIRRTRLRPDHHE